MKHYTISATILEIKEDKEDFHIFGGKEFRLSLVHTAAQKSNHFLDE